MTDHDSASFKNGALAPNETLRRDFILMALSLVGAAPLAGCGGGGGEESSAEPTPTSPVISADLTDNALVTGESIVLTNTIASSTKTGKYVGNGTSIEVEVGFMPDFIIVCPSTTLAPSYLTRTTWNGRTSFFAEAALGGGATRPRGIVVTESGFSVGALSDVNKVGETFFWFAYADNGGASLLEGDYRGSPSYMVPRLIELFEQKKIKAVLMKRDNSPACVHAYLGKGASDYQGNAASVTLNGDGTFNIGNAPNVNTGESCNVLAFPDKSPNTFVFYYVGNAAARVLPLPWRPDAVIIMPITPAAVRGGIWLDGMGASYKPMSNSGPLTTGVSGALGETISLTAQNNFNQSGVTYVCYAFRRSRTLPLPPAVRTLRSSKVVITGNNGHIDCGTSNTLRISGALTLEIFCAHNQVDTTVFAGPNYNDEPGKQSPMMFRSNGADGVMGAVSFGLAAIAQWPTTWSAGVPMPYPSITFAQSPIWQIWNGSISQQRCPIMSGIGTTARNTHHYVLTHDGHGRWRLYLDGVFVKDVNDDLSRDTNAGGVPPSNIVGGDGHRMIFGGRKRGGVTIDHCNSLIFREARIYSRALTPQEVRHNYESLWEGGPTCTPDFTEQWLAENASGATLPATVHAENSGSVVNGFVLG